jgi:hypothetical protein
VYFFGDLGKVCSLCRAAVVSRTPSEREYEEVRLEGLCYHNQRKPLVISIAVLRVKYAIVILLVEEGRLAIR